ncbi:hypothetical protein PENNAL_c0044G04384 [Penicillium nalgiovense]|uniref:Ammonium transporter AmtB-like domain-containing protein n=1 Tax=Penicillium nalgiovense TaxID=60175 RepID=A0A1V6Y091_PENNA|nr:hypothetical protein PENNAL_c0044G04384 [Penicillium nalgiovense]
MTLIMADAPVYNVSTPTGGDPLKVDANAQYVGVEWNYTYIILCSFIVWLIIPGIGLLYSGLARRKSTLALLFQAFMVVAVITLQWIFWGYSLTYARDASPFIGTLRNFGLRGVMVAPSPGSADLPEIVFCFYQLLFCACTLLLGDCRLLPPSLLDLEQQRWLYNLPSLDFAGGGPVHIASGWSALAYAFVLGKRKNIDCTSHAKPHNTSLVFLGTALIWFGWFGFNVCHTCAFPPTPPSKIKSDSSYILGRLDSQCCVREMLAAFNTNTAACTGVLGWVLVDYIKHRGKFSVVGACEGAIAGLVGITPAAGFVSVWLAAVIGFLTSITCALLQDINEWLHIDEGMDVFKLHGIGGMVGPFLTGIFASQSIAALDGVTEATGGIDGNRVQVGKQLAEVCAISAYSFIVSCILLYILKFIPGMQLRVHEEVEMVGLDRSQFIDEQIGERVLLDDLGGSSSSVLDGISVVGSQEKK